MLNRRYSWFASAQEIKTASDIYELPNKLTHQDKNILVYRIWMYC